MKTSSYTLTPKRGNYLMGMIIFGAGSIAGPFIAPSEVAFIISGFFGLFFLVNLILFIIPSAAGAQISTKVTENGDLSMEQRLQALFAAHSRGLVTDEEFAKKRQSIIDSL